MFKKKTGEIFIPLSVKFICKWNRTIYGQENKFQHAVYNYYGAYDSFIPSRSLFFHMDVTKFSSNTATSGIMGSVVEEGIKINDNILFMSVDIFKCY